MGLLIGPKKSHQSQFVYSELCIHSSALRKALHVNSGPALLASPHTDHLRAHLHTFIARHSTPILSHTIPRNLRNTSQDIHTMFLCPMSRTFQGCLSTMFRPPTHNSFLYAPYKYFHWQFKTLSQHTPHLYNYTLWPRFTPTSSPTPRGQLIPPSLCTLAPPSLPPQTPLHFTSRKPQHHHPPYRIQMGYRCQLQVSWAL